MRVAIVFDNFGPYHLARMRGAAAHMEVIAVEVAARSADYAWERADIPQGMRYLLLTDRPEDRRDQNRLKALIAERIEPLAPDVVAVPGWSSPVALSLAEWAARRGVPAVVMTETNRWDFPRRPAAEAIKRGVLAHFATGLGTSEAHADYLADLGLPRSAVSFGYNAVDNDYFSRESHTRRQAGALPARVAAMLPEAARGRYFLASNRFIEKKNLSRLLRAYAAFRADRGDDPADWPLMLLGDGELRGALEAERDALGLGCFVHMPGFCQYGGLPDFYGTAGAFVHASTTEQWGLVVNEAMASALPVAVSDRCGCTAVLVRDGVNGWSFDPFDESAIASALRRLAAADDLVAMGEAGAALIADWGPARFGTGMAEAARRALAARRRRPGLVPRVALRLAARWSGR